MVNVITRERVLKWLYFSDVHFPFADEGALEWLFRQIQTHKPDRLICGGDVMDADAASRFESEKKHVLKDEYELADKFLQACWEAMNAPAPVLDGESYCEFIEGNHERNILSKCRINEKVRALCDYRLHVKALKHWGHSPYVSDPAKCATRIGQVSFVHGFTAARLSDSHTAQTYGEEWGLTVYGHTHRPEGVHRCKHGALTLNRWAANAGTLMQTDPAPDYMERKSMTDWGQAIVIGEAVACKELRRGRHWKAQTILREMAWKEPVDEVCKGVRAS